MPNDTEERVLSEINQRLARIEELIDRLLTRYEPILAEAARRMEGAIRWRRDRG